MEKTVRLLGTRGVPASHGGFETAVQNVGPYLAARGWRVIVYCQVPGHGPITEDHWRGLERVLIPVDGDEPRSTAKFDLFSVRHAIKTAAPRGDIALLFGYNTALLNVAQRAKRIPLVINMDGIEWQRSGWGPGLRLAFRVNERIACLAASHLIADHPEIQRHLATKAAPSKISMIAYGADAITEARTDITAVHGLEPGKYLTLVCRSIPENSILEIVEGFSARTRGVRLAIFGRYEPDVDPYHRAVVEAAGPEVSFLGSIYDPAELAALRLHGIGYLHGHTVGGTNPSLVEALAVGNPVIAHDNVYNRWTAGDAGLYFQTATEVADRLDQLVDSPVLQSRLRANSRRRHREDFTWEHVCAQYEDVLERFL
jgi:glycosyltransferase involved in cell wall biosynthesis